MKPVLSDFYGKLYTFFSFHMSFSSNMKLNIWR